MISSGSGKQKGAIILIAASAIIIVQLLQMAVLHDIKGGTGAGLLFLFIYGGG